MQKTRPLPKLLVAFIGLAAGLDAVALGFGGAAQGVVLGQPLNFTVELRLDRDEALAPACVSAEVMAGEQPVPPSRVRTVLEERGARTTLLRVSTSTPVDDVVVAVNVAVGCTSPISRRFLLFADPPQQALPGRSAPPTPLTAAAVAAPPSQRSSVQLVAERGTAGTLPRAGAPQPPMPSGPRLQLDDAELPPVDAGTAVSSVDAVLDEAIAAVQAAASAARTAAVAASASAQRIATLEQALQAARAQALVSQQEAAAWRDRADAAPPWLTPLLLALAALAGLAGWLAWRLRALQNEQQQGWLSAAAAKATAAGPSRTTATKPLVTSQFDVPPSNPTPLPAGRPDWPAPAAAAGAPPATAPSPATAVDLPFEPPAHQRTEVLPPVGARHDGAPRDVTIDELLDLEQQADFFVVLGQDDAAVELLVEHLRITGGGSPLPYLKLLEIYRRRGDRDAYERTRTRFNDRFNAYASEWDSDLQAGRALDDYPGVLPRLQQVWPRPLDAMAELEALLFRKSRGELFDLPAYREVLFLYSLARDLLEREPPEAGQVDLLLPLADGGEFSSTSPAPFLSLHPDEPDAQAGGRPTPPLDLDLDLATPSVRAGLFDPPSRH